MTTAINDNGRPGVIYAGNYSVMRLFPMMASCSNISHLYRASLLPYPAPIMAMAAPVQRDFCSFTGAGGRGLVANTSIRHVVLEINIIISKNIAEGNHHVAGD